MLALSIIWFLAVGGGTLALAIAVGYIMVTRRKLTEDEKMMERVEIELEALPDWIHVDRGEHFEENPPSGEGEGENPDPPCSVQSAGSV